MRLPIFVCGVAGVAASLAAAPARAAGSDLDDLARWAAGTWRCQSRAGAEAYTFTLAFSWDLDKKWLVARLDGRAKGRNEKVRSVNVYGWDGTQLVSTFMNNQGARGTSTSPGWDGDRLVFSGTVDIAGYHTATTSTLTRRGKRELVLSARTGSFAAETTCKK